MNQVALLLHHLPCDAKEIVEFGRQGDTLSDHYARINPNAVYRVYSAEHEECQIHQADCLVYSSLKAEAETVARFCKQVQELKYGGRVIVLADNAQHWKRVAALIKGEPFSSEESQSGFILENLRRMFAELGLSIYDIKPLGKSSPEFNLFWDNVQNLTSALGMDKAVARTRLGTERYLICAVKQREPVPRMLVQTMLMSTMASDTIRVYQPDRCLGTIPGVRTVATLHKADLTIGHPIEKKVFIWQRQRLKNSEALKKQAQLIERGYLIIAEIDDDPLFWPDHAENDFITFRSVHGIQTSTPYLANILKEFNPNVVVFQNQIDVLPPPRKVQRDEPITLFFGAFNREQDWESLMPALNEVLQEFVGKVICQVIYDRKFFDSLSFPDKEFTPLCSYEEYQKILQKVDVAWLPLNDTRFNHCKSDLKFIQCAAHGVAVLASPVVYQHSVQDGKTGLLYYSVEEFKDKLRALLEDVQLRRQITSDAYQWVKEHRMLYQHYRQRYDWYLKMYNQLPQLNRELAKRVAKY